MQFFERIDWQRGVPRSGPALRNLKEGNGPKLGLSDTGWHSLRCARDFSAQGTEPLLARKNPEKSKILNGCFFKHRIGSIGKVRQTKIFGEYLLLK
jgi:hypothetical protein